MQDDEESSESEAETEDLEIVSVDEGGYADPPPTREGEPEVPAELQVCIEHIRCKVIIMAARYGCSLLSLVFSDTQAPSFYQT